MKLLNLSEKIDPPTIAIYELLANTAADIGLEYVVVGATARDLILDQGYGIPATRATIDIDLGIEVDDWSQFEKLKENLLATGRFTDTSQVQRLMYNDNHPIDILPYGGISEDGVNIEWPPDHDIQMSVAGFREAFESSVRVILREDPFLEIKVASLPCLAALKLIAWKERGASQNKDAKDIATIVSSYWELHDINDRLYGDEATILESEDFTNDLAGARLLGKDIAKISGTELLETLKEILDQETTSEHNRLAESMSLGLLRRDFEKNHNYLNKIKQGLNAA